MRFSFKIPDEWITACSCHECGASFDDYMLFELAHDYIMKASDYSLSPCEYDFSIVPDLINMRMSVTAIPV